MRKTDLLHSCLNWRHKRWINFLSSISIISKSTIFTQNTFNFSHLISEVKACVVNRFANMFHGRYHFVLFATAFIAFESVDRDVQTNIKSLNFHTHTLDSSENKNGWFFRHSNFLKFIINIHKECSKFICKLKFLL